MKKMKKISLVLLVLLMMCTLVACGKKGTESETDTSVTSTENETVTVTENETESVKKPTTDRSGAQISIPENVEKIVSLAPSMTETLINLGCAENIIAIDTQTQNYGYEQLANDLPAFDMLAPDTEQLVALKPDVIFVSGITDITGADLYADVKDMGICVINIPSSESIQGVKDDIAFIASCVGKEEKGEQIIADMTEEIEKIAEIGKTITDKKTVYFEISPAPSAYSFGNGTFLNEMIELIGAENILGEQEGWLAVETESVVSANPDVILTNVNYIENPVEEILSREGWSGVNAVANKNVYYIDNQSASLPNENIVKALKEIAVAVYPDVYEK